MSENKMRTILFLCTANSCRSQMAEGFAREILPEGWRVFSAGTIAAGVHPRTIQAMREAGVDITGQHSKALFEIPLEEVDHVVTLCGSARDRCPVFPAAREQEHWPIEDPLSCGSSADPLKPFRRARDDIRKRVEELAARLAGSGRCEMCNRSAHRS